MINGIHILGFKAWASGKLDDFGMLISASGLSSIHNYECGKDYYVADFDFGVASTYCGRYSRSKLLTVELVICLPFFHGHWQVVSP